MNCPQHAHFLIPQTRQQEFASRKTHAFRHGIGEHYNIGASVLFIAYATYTNNNLYNEILMRFLLLIISGVCTLYGIVEMKKNYEKDKEVQDIEYAYTKQRLIRDLLRLEKS